MSAMRPHSKRLCRPLFEGRDLAGRTVARDHDLLLGVVEGIEDVEELFLCPVLARDELDVVDEEHVDGAVLVTEGGQAIEADGVDHLVDEAIGRDVQQVQAAAVPGLDVVPDGVHEVRLAQAHAAIQEERVVALGGDLGHRARRGVGELIGGADDEALECVLGVEDGEGRRFLVGRRRGFGLRGRLRVAVEEDVDFSPPELVEGLRNDAVIVLGQPILELGVGHAHVEGGALEAEGRRRPEPGGEAVAVDFGLHLRRGRRPRGSRTPRRSDARHGRAADRRLVEIKHV
jgi:hypothetical protein